MFVSCNQFSYTQSLISLPSQERQPPLFLSKKRKHGETFFPAIVQDSKQRRKIAFKTIVKWRRAVWNAARIGKGLLSVEKQGFKGAILKKNYWLEVLCTDHPVGYFAHSSHRKSWQDSHSNESITLWEHRIDAIVPCDKRVWYCTPEEKEQFKISFYKTSDQNALCIQKDDMLDTIDNPQIFIYVLSPDQHLYVAPSRKGCFHHSSFLAGGAILGGGEIEAKNGRIVSINNKSGHYELGEKEMMQVLYYLYKQGVDLRGIKLKDYSISENIEMDAWEYFSTRMSRYAWFSVND